MRVLITSNYAVHETKSLVLNPTLQSRIIHMKHWVALNEKEYNSWLADELLLTVECAEVFVESK